MTTHPTFGVEEEFLLVDPGSGEPVPLNRAVAEQAKAKGVEPEGYVLHSYAAVQVWAQAVAKAGTTDARQVMQTLKAGEWDSVMGKLSFDAKGDIKQTGYILWKWDSKGNAVELVPGKGS